MFSVSKEKPKRQKLKPKKQKEIIGKIKKTKTKTNNK